MNEVQDIVSLSLFPSSFVVQYVRFAICSKGEELIFGHCHIIFEVIAQCSYVST